MKEEVVTFGRGGRLVGILTTGVGRAHDPCVVLLNSGLIHRVGPNRLYVTIARHAARLGCPTLRMDFSGIGDSAPRADNLPFEKSTTLEVQDAFEAVTQRTGCRRFVLAGICSGAEAAVQIGADDPRVAGIVPIEFYGYDSTSYQLRLYQDRMLRPKNWARLLTGKTSVFATMRSRLPLIAGGSAGVVSAPPITDVQLPLQERTEKVLSNLTTILDREAQICLVYAGGGSAHFNYRRHFARALRPYAGRGLLQVHALEGSDHGFTLKAIQTAILGILDDWLPRLFQAGDGARREDRLRPEEAHVQDGRST